MVLVVQKSYVTFVAYRASALIISFLDFFLVLRETLTSNKANYLNNFTRKQLPNSGLF